MSAITTHVLDTTRGLPAAGVRIVLERLGLDGDETVGRGETDADGRLRTLLPAGEPPRVGIYRLRFDTAHYFADVEVEGFYPEVAILFKVQDPGRHYHVPLLLSPYGYSTYRGS